MSHTVYPFQYPTGANGEIVSREEAGGVVLDMRTSASAGRNSLVHAAIHDGGLGALTISAAQGVTITVLPNGPGEPLFVWPAPDQA